MSLTLRPGGAYVFRPDTFLVFFVCVSVSVCVCVRVSENVEFLHACPGTIKKGIRIKMESYQSFECMPLTAKSSRLFQYNNVQYVLSNNCYDDFMLKHTFNNTWSRKICCLFLSLYDYCPRHVRQT